MSIIKIFAGNPEFPYTEDVCLECLMGSKAYGAQVEDSDHDVHAVVVPPKEILYPGAFGKILGWDYTAPLFESYEHHGLRPESLAHLKSKIDLKVISVVTFINMCFAGNPNFIDMLFADESNIITVTPAGEVLRANKEMFVTKLAARKQAYFARNVMVSYSDESKTLKSAYIAVRAIGMAKQFIEKGTANLKSMSSELKDIRNGKYTVKELLDRVANDTDFIINSGLESADIPAVADEAKTRWVLESAIDSHYSNLCMPVTTGVHQTYHE